MNNNQPSHLLKCFINGQYRSLSIEQAHQELWRAHYGWVTPINWYRWGIEKYHGSEYLLQKITPQPVWLALLVHMSTCPVTIDICEEKLNEINQQKSEFDGRLRKHRELDANVFSSWAARFHKLFQSKDGKVILPKKFWPLSYEPVLNGPCFQGRPAYRIAPGRSSVVILDVDPDFDRGESPVIWSQLLEPPERQPE